MVKYNSSQFTVTCTKVRGLDFWYNVTKQDDKAQWPGEGGQFPPASFLEAVHNNSIFYGELDSQNPDGSRTYFICSEVSFL